MSKAATPENGPPDAKSAREWNWDPQPGETPKEYVERVGAWQSANIHGFDALKKHFGLDHRLAKTALLDSQSFWNRFLRERLTRMCVAGNQRLTAIKFVKERVDWPEEKISAFVDSIGEWKK